MAKKKAANKKPAKKKTKKAKINRSQEIRDYLAKDPNAGPKAIVAGLKKKGIKVTEGLASAVKYKQPAKKKKKRGRKPQAAADKISVSALVSAKKMADTLGGIEEAKAALDAVAKLQ